MGFKQSGGLTLPTSLTSAAASLRTAVAGPLTGIEAVGTEIGSISTSLKNNWMYILGALVVVGIVLAGIFIYVGILPNPFKSVANPTQTTSALSAAVSATAAVGTATAGSSTAAVGTATAGSSTAAAGSRVSGFQSGPEGFQMPAVPAHSISPEDATLLNLQPLTIKDAGFAGPYPTGEFDAENATANALKAGFRCLTLQIDYMTSSKQGFEDVNVPTLLVRSTNGSLLSSNSGSIATVATTIANMAFRPEVPHNTQPIILYLHINRAPSAIQDPAGYKQFLSKIAMALNPLAPMHLGLNPLGNFTRQKMEDILLTTPISSLSGQVIILCNADTSTFRVRKGEKHYNPDQDLDFWVNMRVYLDSEEDSFGLAQLPDNRANAVIVDLGRVTKLSAALADRFAAKGKGRFVIGMGDRIMNPTAANVDTAINKLGINSVPLDIFTKDTTEIMNIVAEYSNMPYHPKPTALQQSG